LTLDEPKEDDTFYKERSIPFVIEKSAQEMLSNVSIDYRHTWMGKSLVISGKSKGPGVNNACFR